MNGLDLAHPAHFVPRPDMPQIGPDDGPALIEWLAWLGVAVDDVWLDPSRLHFRQHVSAERIAAMPAWAYESPIWISAEGDVLDGNHRAMAHKQRGELCRCLRLPVPFARALRLLFTFAGTTDGQAL